MPRLEIIEVALVNYNIANNDYEHYQECCIHFFPINCLVNY